MPSKVPTHRPANHGGQCAARREYDRNRRDREAKSFLDRRSWRGKSGLRLLKLRLNPCCERCLEQHRIVPATVVHHRIERSHDPSLGLDLDNLESLCASCHSKHHASQTHQP